MDASGTEKVSNVCFLFRFLSDISGLAGEISVFPLLQLKFLPSQMGRNGVPPDQVMNQLMASGSWCSVMETNRLLQAVFAPLGGGWCWKNPC